MTRRTGHDRGGPDADEPCAMSDAVLEQANTATEPRLAKRALCAASRAEDRLTFEAVGAPLVPPHP